MRDLIERLMKFGERYKKILALLSVISIAVLLLAFFGGWIPLTALASIGYVGVFLLNIVSGASILFSGPGQAVTFGGGGELAPLLVGVVAGVGNAFGELSGYFLGRAGLELLSPWFIQKIEAVKGRRLYRALMRFPFLTLSLMAAVPNPFFDMLSITLGTLKVPFRTYFLPVLCGKIARFVLIAYLGSRLLS